jgi:transcriptional regulator with XRE-family HTH domain
VVSSYTPPPAAALLDAWLKAKSIERTELARALGVSEQLLYQWRSGRSRPSHETAQVLERISGSVVPASEWAFPTEVDAAVADALESEQVRAAAPRQLLRKYPRNRSE